MSEFVIISTDGSSYSIVWVKEESVFFNNLQSIFLIVLRKEDQLLLYMGKWSKKFEVDSTSKPHLLHNGFSKF